MTVDRMVAAGSLRQKALQVAGFLIPDAGYLFVHRTPYIVHNDSCGLLVSNIQHQSKV